MPAVPEIMRVAETGQADQLADVLREKALSSLYYFAKVVLNYNGLVDHLHLPFCERVQDNRNVKRGFLLPRGHFKSTIVSKAYPLWRLLHNPELRILIIGESDTVAQKNLNDPKWNLLNNQILKWLFPEIIPPDTRATKWTQEEILLPRKGTYDESSITCKGVGVKTTGFHYDLIIYDDIFGHEAAHSEAEAKSVIEWVKLAPGLLVHQEESEELFIGTRWKHGTGDVYGYLMETDVIPKKYWYIRSAVENGEVIFPERFNEKVLEEVRKREGTYNYSCQYLNDPTPPEGSDFPESMLGEYEVSEDKTTILPCDGTPPVPLTSLYRISFYDVSSGGIDAKAENAIVGAGMSSDRRIFFFTAESGTYSVGDAIEKWAVMNDHFIFYHNYYEKVGNQKTVEDIYLERLAQPVCRHCEGEHRFLNPEPVAPTTRWSKEERIRYFASDAIKQMRVYLMKGMRMHKLRTQITCFPHIRPIDLFDAGAYVINKLRPPVSDEEQADRKQKALVAEQARESRVHSEINYGGYV